MRLFKQLFWVFTVLGALFVVMLFFTYDIIKIEWVSFMEIQPAYRSMEDPLPVPARSIPVEGPAFIPNIGAPDNPVPSDEASLARARELYVINCQMCHGETGRGTGPIAAFLLNKPADLTGALVQDKTDSTLFTSISNGVPGRMPPLNENLTVRDRWDLVNFIRTLAASE